MRLLLLVAVAVFALAVAPFGTGAPPGTVEAFGFGSVVDTFRITFTPAGTNVLIAASTEWDYVAAPPGALDGRSGASIDGNPQLRNRGSSRGWRGNVLGTHRPCL